MKKLLVPLIFFFSLTIYGQKEASFWYFGHNAALDFNSGTPTPVSGSQLNTFEGCSTISDKNGNLLFYSDGVTVYDKNHDIMTYTNGRLANNLKGDSSSTQSSIIIPKPGVGNESIYYLFTVDDGPEYDFSKRPPILIENGKGLNYYAIDMSLSNGNGQLIDENGDGIYFNGLSDGLQNNWSEKLAAIEGLDCNTLWVISTDNNNFYAFKIDTKGVNTIAKKSIFGQFINTKRGALKLSPNGKKLVLANQDTSSYIFDFNNKDGSISNKKILNLSGEKGYGVGFSNTSNKLYISTGVHSQFNNTPKNASIYQFDLNATEINSSKIKIYSEIGFRGALQLGIDNKIYYASSRKTHLGVINAPDENGVNVKFEPNGIKLAPNSTSSEGLPPFIQSFFTPIKIIDSNTKKDISSKINFICFDERFSIEPDTTVLKGKTITNYKWTKEDDPKVNINTKNITIDRTNFGSGVYNLEINAVDNCKRTIKYTGFVKIEFVPKLIINRIPTFVQCDFDSNPSDFITNFNLASKKDILYTGTENVTIKFFEITDTFFSTPLDENNYINSIPTSSINGSHKIMVKVTNTTTQCFQTTIIDLEVKPTGLEYYEDEYICDIDINASNPNSKFSIGSNNNLFDFSKKTAKIIVNSRGTLSDITHNFQYYITQKDARLQINEIIPSLKKFLVESNARIYIRVSNKIDNSCEKIGSFNIFIENIPNPKGDLNGKFLCLKDSLTGSDPFIILNADTGFLNDTYQWYFNGNKILGANKATYRAIKEGEYKIEVNRNYPNIDNSCIGFNTFVVKESNIASIDRCDVTINDAIYNDTTGANAIAINNSNNNLGVGDYEFALVNQQGFTIRNYQDQSFFDNLKGGIYTILVRDKNGCGVASLRVAVIEFPKFFTPNNDGKNDTFSIIGINKTFFPNNKITILNRYGKIIYQFNSNSNGWNGLYKGKQMPSSDYWFKMMLVDIDGNKFTKQGHFSLIRK